MNCANLSAAEAEIAALLRASCEAAIHQSSRSDPLMTGSMAFPELMAATVAQLSQKMSTVDPARVGSHSRAATRRFQHSRLEMESPKSWR